MFHEFAGYGEVPTQEMDGLIKAAYSSPEGHARLAKALTVPLQSAVLKGDILQDIYVPEYFAPSAEVSYPIDFLTDGHQKDFVAFAIPQAGAVPSRVVEGDMVRVPLYEDGNAIDCNKRFIRDGRWSIVDRMMEVLINGHTVKMNRDGWRAILAAGVNRGLAIYDSEAAAGYFTKREVSLLMTGMSRYGGGNSTSINRFKLTDLYMSVESMADIRNWDLTQIDDQTRRQIFVAGGDGGLTTIYGVTLHELYELGVGQEFQNYYANTLGGTMPGSKTEIVIGLDLSKRASAFAHPWRERPTVQEDLTQARARRYSLWSFAEHGFSVLDNRPVLIGCV